MVLTVSYQMNRNDFKDLHYDVREELSDLTICYCTLYCMLRFMLVCLGYSARL